MRQGDTRKDTFPVTLPAGRVPIWHVAEITCRRLAGEVIRDLNIDEWPDRPLEGVGECFFTSCLLVIEERAARFQANNQSRVASVADGGGKHFSLGIWEG